jgi:1,2-diacylglycerol 3-alpha-glucosyltransferase
LRLEQNRNQVKVMKWNIIFFNDSFPPVIDGVANVVLNYAKALGEMGWNCTVIAPDAPGAPRGEEVKVLRYKSLPLPGRYPFRIGIPAVDLKFKKKLDKLEADIIHVHCPFTSGWLGLDFARERKIPLVGTFHSQYAYDFKNAVQFDFLVKISLSAVVRFYNKMDFVWVPDDSAGKALKSYGYNGKYLCMPNGTDFINKDDMADLQHKGSQLLNAKPEEFILMYAGRLVREKNLMILCETMNELRKKGATCRLIFIGEGYYSRDLTHYTGKHKLGDYITFLGPVYDREKLKCCISRANIFLFPSLYDMTIALALQEAAALNIPIVLVSGSPIADKIKHGVNGFLCPNNPHDWASIIINIMHDNELLVSVGNRGRMDLVNDWKTIVKQVESNYEDYIQHWKGIKKTGKK